MGQDAAELIRRARFYMPDEYAPGGLVRALADALERVTPRVVTTVAELDALPASTVIMRSTFRQPSCSPLPVRRQNDG